MQSITMTEREVEVAQDGTDVVIRDEHNRIKLRPAQVMAAATELLDCAERIRPGSWSALWRLLAVTAGREATSTPGPICPRVGYDLTIYEAEPNYDEPGPHIEDVCLDQWITGEVEAPDFTGLERIYVAPGQAPRVAYAMLEALRQVAPGELHACAVAALRKQALSMWTFTPIERVLFVLIAKQKRQLDELEAKRQTPKPTKKRRSKSARR